ncbi:LeuD/DmdB family oxidoreductase small subunit [Prolixibacter bellariivorans]|uniref:LeuD/DmdB family oxidoreductase small subunit n=1 Tax=Prolixibacter bellariivorans TaxID=314319 RepID=UPI0021D0677A|nr:hypothetical protein [Prolixibacter bellariivorans]
MYLASPATAAASAVAGHITTEDDLPEQPSLFQEGHGKQEAVLVTHHDSDKEKPSVIEGRVWLVMEDNIDTDMIFHNQHLAITELSEMGKYTFGNLKGWEDFASKAQPGDMVITGKNFGAGSSRQQAVDCFKSLGVQAVLAESFGAIYERNAINAGFPIMTYESIEELELQNGDVVAVEFETGKMTNRKTGKSIMMQPFSDVQMEIYRKGDLLHV